MAEGATAQVQAYLDKHKISSLFEDLMSKIVKDLPADPLEYLVGKIQALQRQKKRGVSPRAPTGTSAVRARSKMQVTGTAVTPKSSSTGKEHLSKSVGSTRPVKPRTELISSSTPSLTKATPTKSRIPTKTSPRPSTATKTPAATKTKTTPARTIPVTKRPTTAPSPAASKTSKIRPPSAGNKTKLMSTTKVITSKKTTLGDTSTSKSKPTPLSSKTVTQTKKVTKTSKKNTSTEEEINEFFGEPRKSSPSHLRVESEDEGSEFDGPSDSDDSDGMTVGRNDGTGGDSGHEEDKSLNLEELILKHNMTCKHARKAQNREMVHSLLAPASSETTPSLGYYSDSEDSEEDSEALEMAEDYAALEEEGVTGVTRGKYTIRETPSTNESAMVDLKVLICARCARVLTGEDQGTEVTRSELTGSSLQTGGGEFESASQIGSQASFPQWEAGSAIDSELSSPQISSRSHDSGSDVTLQSHDTWGGLAPQPRPLVAASDVESEIQLPTPPPLEGKPWLQDPPPQHDVYGWAQHEEEDNH